MPETIDRRALLTAGVAVAVAPVRATSAPSQPGQGPIIALDSKVAKDFLVREQTLEMAILTNDVAEMRRIFANDFVFYYYRGRSSLREEWIAQAVTNGFRSRTISGFDVELHGDLAITGGELLVRDKGGPEGDTHRYKYVRVWRRTGAGWQLVSHRTVAAPTRLQPSPAP